MNELNDIMYLINTSELHKTWRMEEIKRCVMTPMLLDQYKILKDNNDPVMFVTWGFPNHEQVNTYISTKHFPQEGYDGKGENVWVVDFISKKDYTLKGMKFLKYYFRNQGYKCGYWLRQTKPKIGFHFLKER
tara:strand:- start:5717 stop:6112 length:396 start_codon:yes stop_codon:yes gene_type:complete